MTSENEGPKIRISMPKNINCISIITLEGIEKVKTLKNDSKTVFLSPTLLENSNKHCSGLSISIGLCTFYSYLIVTLHWPILAR